MSYMIDFMKNRPLKKFPEYLCYRHPKSNVYMLSNKEGKLVGRMVAMPEYISDGTLYNPNKAGYFSLYIKRLFIEKEFRKKGAGRAFLNIAAKDSYNRSCQGNVHLVAQALESGGAPPQPFYRKFGFDSQNKSQMKAVDEFIKNGTPLPKYKWTTLMYFPADKK